MRSGMPFFPEDTIQYNMFRFVVGFVKWSMVHYELCPSEYRII